MDQSILGDGGSVSHKTSDAGFAVITRAVRRFRPHGPLVLIVVLTLCTRLAYYASNPRPATGPWVYGAMAHNIIDDGHWFQLNANAGPNFSLNAPLKHVTRVVAPAEANLAYADAHPRWVPFAWEPVGESVLVAGLWELTGSQTYFPDVLMKVILDALAALLLYRVTLRLFKRRRTALIAALLYALYPPIAEVVVNPNRDFWSLDITIALAAMYMEAISSKRPRRWLVGCGILAGVGAYFDPGVLILPGAIALTLARSAGWHVTLRRALIPTVIALVLIVPWTVRNYNDFHQFIFMHIGLGTVLWQGLAELPSPYGPNRSDYVTYLQVRRAVPDIRGFSPAYDSYLRRKALALIERHPLFYVRTIAHRVWISTLGELDFEWARGGTTTPFAYARGPLAYVVEKPFQLLQVMLMPLVFLFAALSLGFTWTRYRQQHVLLLGTILAIVLPYFILAAESRYTMPMAIGYLIWIGLGSDLLLERLGVWRTHGRGQAATSTPVG
jgi:4-amino-4-deoxy-L-arabinose transferase-like glycosyltransferase